MVNPVPVSSNALIGANSQPDVTFHKWMKSVNAAHSATEANKAAKAQVWEQSFFIEYPEDGDYKLVLGAEIARTILKVATVCVEGSATVTTKINTTALGGSPNSVTTTKQEQAHSTNNVQDVGEDLVFTFASTSSCTGVSITVSGTLNLA